MANVREPRIDHITIIGRISVNGEDYQRLTYLAYKYREAVRTRHHHGIEI